MAELQSEDGFTFGSVGTDAVDDVVEGIVDALVESEVIANEGRIIQLLRFEVLDPGEVEKRYFYFVFIFNLVAGLFLLFQVSAPHIPQNLNWLALIVIGDLLERVLAVMLEQIFKQSLSQVEGVLIGGRLAGVCHLVLDEVGHGAVEGAEEVV